MFFTHCWGRRGCLLHYSKTFTLKIIVCFSYGTSLLIGLADIIHYNHVVLLPKSGNWVNPLLSRPFATEVRGLLVSTVLSVTQWCVLESCKALEDDEESVVDLIGPLLLLNLPVFIKYTHASLTSVFSKHRKTNIKNPCREFSTTNK